MGVHWLSAADFDIFSWKGDWDNCIVSGWGNIDWHRFGNGNVLVVFRFGAGSHGAVDVVEAYEGGGCNSHRPDFRKVNGGRRTRPVGFIKFPGVVADSSAVDVARDGGSLFFRSEFFVGYRIGGRAFAVGGTYRF